MVCPAHEIPMHEIEQRLGRLLRLLDREGIRLDVERKSDFRLTPDDRVVRFSLEDGTVVTITEHQPGYLEAWAHNRRITP